MVTHKKLQQYKRYYCKTVITGLFGGRWHRYQQSKDETRKRDLLWIILLVAQFLYCGFWFYFWLVVGNSSANFNEYMYENTGTWFDWHQLIVGLSATLFIYSFLLMVLLVIHIILYHELYLHWAHRIVLFLLLLWNISITVTINQLFYSGWSLVYLSFQISGPFLQFVAVFIMTFLSWPLGTLWASMYSLKRRVILLVVYISVMLFIYLSPLMLDSPCVCESLPSHRPSLIAHRGGAKLGPENTLLAINRTMDKQHSAQFITGMETDISISYSGSPFLIHDSTLKRTTNVGDVFPDRVDNDPAFFNDTDLKLLDFGSWFLKKDPFNTASSLSSAERHRAKNTSVTWLRDLLPVLKSHNLTLMFDFKLANEQHPYFQQRFQILEAAFNESGFDYNKIQFLYHHNLNDSSNSHGYSLFLKYSQYLDLEPDSSPESVASNNYSAIHMEYSNMWWKDLRQFHAVNVSSSIYVVDSVWLYSLYWCAGINLVTSNGPDTFLTMNKPLWHMTPALYRAIWISVDVLSLVISVAIFVIHKIHRSAQKYHPETTLPPIQVTREKMLALRKTRTMREKLLRSSERLAELDGSGVIGLHLDDISECASAYTTTADTHSETTTDDRLSRVTAASGAGGDEGEGDGISRDYSYVASNDASLRDSVHMEDVHMPEPHVHYSAAFSAPVTVHPLPTAEEIMHPNANVCDLELQHRPHNGLRANSLHGVDSDDRVIHLANGHLSAPHQCNSVGSAPRRRRYSANDGHAYTQSPAGNEYSHDENNSVATGPVGQAWQDDSMMEGDRGYTRDDMDTWSKADRLVKRGFRKRKHTSTSSHNDGDHEADGGGIGVEDSGNEGTGGAHVDTNKSVAAGTATLASQQHYHNPSDSEEVPSHEPTVTLPQQHNHQYDIQPHLSRNHTTILPTTTHSHSLHASPQHHDTVAEVDVRADTLPPSATVSTVSLHSPSAVDTLFDYDMNTSQTPASIATTTSEPHITRIAVV